MIVLASASPRRKELLERAGFEFISVPAQTEEITGKNRRRGHAGIPGSEEGGSRSPGLSE